MRRRGTSAGFTMVEILVAVAIMAGVAGVLWRTMAGSFEAKNRVNEINERYQEARQVLDRMARELRMAFLRKDVELQDREEDPTFVTQFKGSDDEVYFATTAHLRMRAGARESDQAEVHYFLGRSESKRYKGRALMRRESRRIDGRPERGGRIYRLLEGVREFRLEYWDEDKEIGDEAWKSSWDSGTPDSQGQDDDLLPRRVRITLVLDGGGTSKRRKIRFVTQAAPRIRRPIDVTKAQK